MFVGVTLKHFLKCVSRLFAFYSVSRGFNRGFEARMAGFVHEPGVRRIKERQLWLGIAGFVTRKWSRTHERASIMAPRVIVGLPLNCPGGFERSGGALVATWPCAASPWRPLWPAHPPCPAKIVQTILRHFFVFFFFFSSSSVGSPLLPGKV
jgi:hypothetical protein